MQFREKFYKFTLLFGLIIFASCENDSGNFSATAPPNWTKIDSVSKYSERNIIMYPQTTVYKSFTENINISSSDTHFPSNYISGVLNALKEQSDYFEEKETGTVQFGDKKYQWERHLVKLKKSDLREQIGYFYYKNGWVYQIVYTTNPGETGKFQKEVNEVLSSLTPVK